MCPHRGAPLSQGWVQEVKGHDCVVCPYHGWAFDQEGVLRDVPAADKAEAWPRKKLVDSYAVEEKVGMSLSLSITPLPVLVHALCQVRAVVPSSACPKDTADLTQAVVYKAERLAVKQQLLRQPFSRFCFASGDVSC